MADQHPLMNISETARACAVSKETVRRWIEAGLLEHIRLPSGRIRIKRAVVEAFLHSDPQSNGGPVISNSA